MTLAPPSFGRAAWLVLVLDASLFALGIATGIWILIVPMGLALVGQARLMWCGRRRRGLRA